MYAKPFIRAMLLALFFILPAQAATPPTVDHHKVFGRVETALVTDHRIKMRVRMDTGAKTSSLSATNIEIFKKNNKEWVRFNVEPSVTDKLYQIEAPLVRMIKIRKRHAEIDDDETAKPTDKFERRPTVDIPVCLGNQEHLVEVSLTNRSHFNYPMLLGRSGMQTFDILIDPGRVFTVKPKCGTLALREITS